MVCLRPWCTSDPRPCAKYFGIIDITISLIGLLILLCMPFLLLKVGEEVKIIQDNGQGKDTQSNANNPKNYTLRIINTFRMDCKSITDYITEYLYKYIESVGANTIWCNVNLNRSEVVGTQITCEIHVISNKHPYKLIKEKSDSIATAAAKGILLHNLTGDGDADEIKKEWTESSTGGDEIAVQYVYPIHIGNDPERRRCIDDMNKANQDDIQSDYDVVYNLLLFSGIFSVITGSLVTVTEFKVSKYLILSILGMEVICVIPLIVVAILVNKPSLCLLQYGGISQDGVVSPQYLQTVITYICIIYIVAYKCYCMWFLAMYARETRTLIAPRRVSSVAELLTKSQEEMERAVRMKTIQRLMGNQEGGSMQSEESSAESVSMEIDAKNLKKVVVQNKK